MTSLSKPELLRLRNGPDYALHLTHDTSPEQALMVAAGASAYQAKRMERNRSVLGSR